MVQFCNLAMGGGAWLLIWQFGNGMIFFSSPRQRKNRIHTHIDKLRHYQIDKFKKTRTLSLIDKLRHCQIAKLAT
jgi:hypothetical protein